jgi:hypothetical protein
LDQDVANRRLLSAVVAMAIKDACQVTSPTRFVGLPREALDFLFLNSEGYLTWLDIDAEQFRKRLVEYAYSDKKGEDDSFNLTLKERKRFRSNYERWFELTSFTLEEV